MAGNRIYWMPFIWLFAKDSSALGRRSKRRFIDWNAKYVISATAPTQILEQAEQKLEIDCPFCQKTTVIQGSASDLPKNFALIDIINNIFN
ncbi:hypothetical protein L3Y34_000497 [Caenorhabditis briggsae]|uniref:Uncharacterized protein n=1 Tax=Caenorhabditis briggsae TaxID=6238 RepID=A0AAE9D9D6_CAEBR|nr:hypothetical protein L3Y34_000497 [Caenorhabditis briggsae]